MSTAVGNMVPQKPLIRDLKQMSGPNFDAVVISKGDFHLFKYLEAQRTKLLLKASPEIRNVQFCRQHGPTEINDSSSEPDVRYR